MLNTTIERENKDKFIVKERVSLESTSTNPFDRLNNVILSGNLSSLHNNRIDFASWKTEVPKTLNLFETTEENYIENASRDLARQPNNPYLMNNLGKILLKSGKFDEAINLFKRSLDIKPDYLISRLNLASAYEFKGEDTTAIGIYKDILVSNPDDVRAIGNIGNIHLKNKRIQEAKEIFETVLKDHPEDITSLDKLSIIYLIEGKPEKSISLIKKCRDLNSNQPAVYNNLGVAYAALGRYRESIESFKISLKLYPEYKNAVLNLAATFDKVNSIEEAIDLLEKFLKDHESNQAQELLAGLFMKVNKPQKTLFILSQLLIKAREEKVPGIELGRILNNIAVVYHRLHEFEKAETTYLDSVKEGGYAHPVILANLMDLYFELNKFDKVKEYVGILKEKFSNANLHQYYEAKLLIRQGDIQKGSDLLILSIKENENFKPAYTLLGFVLTEFCKQYEEAIKINEIAIKKFPKDVTTINNYAYACLMNNEIDKARTILETANGISNKGPYLNATIGLLKIKEGNIEQGSLFYNTARDLSPNDIFAKMVDQKKNLEIGRYFLNLGEKGKAKEYFNKVLLIRLEGNQFSKEAQELLNQACLSELQ